MRRAIVHIGTPRTGTTTLQRILFSHRADLERAGVLYPDLTPASAAEPHLSHQHLGEALSGRRPARERTELLNRLDALLGASACDVVLLSYEGLCLIPASFGVPAALAAVFGRHGMAMETVLTVKPQSEYLNSTYTWRMQFLREARLFPDFLNASLGGRDCDYARLIAPWRALSPGGVAVVPVRDARSGLPLVERVFGELRLRERLAPMVGGAELGLVENRSPGPLAVEVCRRLRAGGAALALGRRARATTRFVEDAARARGADGDPFIGLDAVLRTRIEARWDGPNGGLAGAVWGTSWSARVAAAMPRPMNEIARLPRRADTEAAIGDILRAAGEAFDIDPLGGPAARLRAVLALPGGMLRHLQQRLRILGRR